MKCKSSDGSTLPFEIPDPASGNHLENMAIANVENRNINFQMIKLEIHMFEMLDPPSSLFLYLEIKYQLLNFKSLI